MGWDGIFGIGAGVGVMLLRGNTSAGRLAELLGSMSMWMDIRSGKTLFLKIWFVKVA